MRKPGSPEGSHKKSTYVAQLGFELGLPSSPLHHPNNPVRKSRAGITGPHLYVGKLRPEGRSDLVK